MNQFVLEAKHRTLLLVGIGVGLLCLVLTAVGDDENLTRFWSNYLHNAVFFLGIAFMAVFVQAAFITAWAGWYTVFKRVWEAASTFLVPALILMIPIIAGLWGHFHHLYHWADADSVAHDPVLQGKASFLNNGWYTFGTLIIVGTWIFFAYKLRSLSLQEEKSGAQVADFKFHRQIRVWAAAFLPIAGFSSAAVIWQWVMSVDAHWYSTLFAWYTAVSWFVSLMALTILCLIFMKGKGYFESVTDEHMHDLGKYLFAFSIFWTYLWFSQFMLIWYANVGEETVYFQTRMEQYPVLFWGNLLLNFITPFFVLMRNDTKRKYGTLAFVSITVLFGHWWDFFQMIKPGVLHTAHEVMSHGAEGGHHAAGFMMGFTIPGLLELGTFIGFLSGFILYFFSQLSKETLNPENDPYIQESLHHHV